MELEERMDWKKDVDNFVENRERAFQIIENQGIRSQNVALDRSCLRPKDQRKKRGPKWP